MKARFDKSSLVTFGVLLIALTVASGCAVGMAASGHREYDDSIVFPGSNRAVVISKLGAPETSRKTDDGTIEDSYLIIKGNESTSGRAWAHAGLDLATFFIWELVATPYELMQTEEKYRLLVTYDKTGLVTDVRKLGVATEKTPDIR